MTLSRVSGVAEFPDCVSERAQRHLRVLMNHVAANASASSRMTTAASAILFLIQRSDCEIGFQASDLDPEYVQLLSEANSMGVLLLPYLCHVDPHKGTVELIGRVPFIERKGR